MVLGPVLRHVVAPVVSGVVVLALVVGGVAWHLNSKFEGKLNRVEGRVNAQRVGILADSASIRADAEAVLTQARSLVDAATAGLATDPAGVRKLVGEISTLVNRIPGIVEAATKAGAAQVEKLTASTLEQLRAALSAIQVQFGDLRAGVDVKVSGGADVNVRLLGPLVEDLSNLINQLLGVRR